MWATTSIGHADALWGSIDKVISTGKEAAVKKFVMHRIAIIVAAIAVGSAGIATEALARGGGGGGGGHGGGLGGAHFGGMGGGHFGGIGGGHFGGAMGGGHLGEGHLGRIGGEHFGGEAEHQHFAHHRGLGYYGDYDACWPPEQGRPRRLRYFC